MGYLGQSLDRVEGPVKVTGAARFAGEFPIEGLTHACTVPATIANGRIARIDVQSAEGAEGVLAVITHENCDKLAYRRRDPKAPVDPDEGERLHVLQGPDVVFSGQPVAIVVAERPEQALHGAALIDVSYEERAARTDICETTDANDNAGDADERGDAETAYRDAPVSIDATYGQPREHHHAIEPHATIAAWEGDHLLLYDKTQWVNNVAREIAHVFDMPEDHIRVVSPYVGGAFGSGLRTWPHVTLAALAARRVGRPVRLELTRRELFTSVGFRPCCRQRVRLGADMEGRLTAIVLDGFSQTSTYEVYSEPTTEPARKNYSCPNVQTRFHVREMNINTPCPMRAPGIVTGTWALESAMDELAFRLSIDPVELRLRNYAERDEDDDLPWSSKELKACYSTAAERFGWERRAFEPGTMRVGDELIGYGMATAAYHANRAPASVSVTVFANGSAIVQSASSDMGPGTYTAMTQIAADALGLSPDRVRFELGDTDLPPAPVHGGSITTASIGNAVAAACEALIDKLKEAATDRDGPLAGHRPETLAIDRHGLVAEDGGRTISFAEILQRRGQESMSYEGRTKPGEETDDYSSSAFGAVFAEVRVDPGLGTVRVPRMVGAYDVGRLINPKTARSQCVGGMVAGMGMALLEEAEWDPRFGRVMNANLAEYLVPVCADAVELEALFVPGEDTIFNPLGVKGLAEIAICGVAPAIANAVYNATGRRVRDLPITPEKLLD